MKVKLDFVTNSSSSCFLMSIPKDEFEDLESSIRRMNNDPDAYNEGVRFYMHCETLTELQEYTNDGPLDWASIPGGPQFWNLNEDSYNLAKKVLNEGNIVVEVAVDHNMCERFYDVWRNSILKETGQ